MWRATNPAARDFRLETFGANWSSEPVEAKGGEVSARSRAAELGRAYLGLSRLGRRRFLHLLAEEFGPQPQEVEAAIRALRAAGETFLIVEHNLGVLTRLVDTLYVMDRGRLLTHGRPDAVMKDRAVHDAYLGGPV